jgi:ubiquinone/menaquinone biosynthesis C-methylase UbiE
VSVITDQQVATMQGELWSARALDWASYQEPQRHEIHSAVLTAVPRLAGQRLLDLGCGSGALLRRVAKHGGSVAGLDAAPGLVAIARQRLPHSEIDVGDLEHLPYATGAFDVVTAVESLHLAADPLAALREARRVVRRQGWLVAVSAGPAARCDSAGLVTAVAALLPPTADAGEGFDEGELAGLVRQAGFADQEEHHLTATYVYEDDTALLRGLLSSGSMVRAAAYSGSYAVTSAVLRAAEPYRAADGSYRLTNAFRYVVARA